MKILRSKKAEGYIDIAVAVLVIVFLLILILSVFSAATQAQDLKYICTELVETAALSGRIGSEVDARYAELCEETGLSPAMTFTAEYFETVTGKVQLGDTISCTLTMETSIMGFGAKIFPFEMTATKSGLSQIYWK